MRRICATLPALPLVAIVAVLTPQPAVAQAAEGYFYESGGGQPLATWCAPTLGGSCVSFLDWEFWYENPGEWDGDGYQDGYGGFSSTVSVTGGVPSWTTNVYFELFVNVLTPFGWRWDLQSMYFSSMSTGRTGDGSLVSGPVLGVTTVHDPMLLIIDESQCVTERGVISARWETAPLCHRIPEPAPVALIAFGLLGMVALRARDRHPGD